MKGIVFNLLQEVVSEEYSADAWDDLLDEAGDLGAYTAVGSYDDGAFLRLVAAGSAKLGIPEDDLVRWFGRQAIPKFRDRLPGLFAPHTSTRSLVLTLNDVIHPEVRKLFPGADVPQFDFQTPDEHSVTIGYASSRRLCAFAEGLIEGAAALYGEKVTHRQPACMKRGDPKCVIECTFEAVA